MDVIIVFFGFLLSGNARPYQGSSVATSDHDGVAIAARVAATSAAAAELHLEAKELAWQCLPSDRGHLGCHQLS